MSASLPTISSGKVNYPVAAAITSTNAEISQLMNDQSNPEASTKKITVLKSDLVKLAAASALDEQIGALTETRKELQSQNLRDKHWVTGSFLLGGGVTTSILGTRQCAVYCL